MISKNEILTHATEINLNPHVVEKDYVLGWLLAGINEHPALKTAWVFKGGTCLKKCYFETYRFSEDLDFTVRDPSHINEGFLRETFVEIAEWVSENTGIEIPDDRMLFEIYKNPRGKDAAQGRIYYRGPVTPAGKQAMPRIKLDLSPDEIVADTPVERSVSHEYSDRPADGISILSYSYAEVFAEKIRALKERTRPRDLYDVINFFRRPESRDLASAVCALLEQKCQFKGITVPTLSDLDDHKEACEGGWREQLSHQLQSLPPFDSFWGELPGFFRWLEHQESPAVALRPIPIAAGDVISPSIFRTPAASGQFGLLDRIRFAAVNRLCVELDYRKESGERKTYLIEPYSLRRTQAGHIILYAVKLPTADGHAQSFRIDRMITAAVSERAFTPRYAIDFLPDLPVNLSIQPPPVPQSTYAPRPRATRPTRGGSAMHYVFKCSVCGRQFTRKEYNASLNPHKNKQGYPCPGRVGIYVTTKF
jgi:predicted nucleotidyltransferase component of viral defense system